MAFANNSYLVGESIYLTNVSPAAPLGFTDDITGDAVDPGIVTLQLSLEGTSTTFSFTFGTDPITKLAVGSYAYTWVTTAMLTGIWWYVWEGSDGVGAVAQQWFSLASKKAPPNV